MPGCSPGTGHGLGTGATTVGDMWDLRISQASELRAGLLLAPSILMEDRRAPR